MTESRTTRRRFLIQAAVAATAVPLLARMAYRPAQAAALQPLTGDNAQAKALHYSDNAAASAKDPVYKAGSACAGCQLFTAATGACALFVGYSVNPKGWCSAWTKKA
jgi:hypothetical protein